MCYIDKIFLQKEHFSTLKGEFLPYLVKKQMSKSLGNTSTHTTPVSDTQSELGTCTKQEVDIFGVSITL